MLSAVACTLASYLLHGNPVLCLLQTTGLYLALETGHGLALDMGRSQYSTADDDRRQFLLPVVNLVNRWFKYSWQSREWCLLFFAVKGAFIGLMLFPAVLVLPWAWRKSYDCSKYKKGLYNPFLPVVPLSSTSLSEYCTGFALMAGLLLHLVYMLIGYSL